jgi:chaperonin GroES
MYDKIRPLYDRVLVKRLEEQEEKTAGGIIIPDAAKEKAQMGKVIAVGQGRRVENGSLIPLQVQVGQTVFFSKYGGSEAGKELLILREDDILGIVEK